MKLKLWLLCGALTLGTVVMPPVFAIPAMWICYEATVETFGS